MDHLPESIEHHPQRAWKWFALMELWRLLARFPECRTFSESLREDVLSKTGELPPDWIEPITLMLSIYSSGEFERLSRTDKDLFAAQLADMMLCVPDPFLDKDQYQDWVVRLVDFVDPLRAQALRAKLERIG